MPVQNEHTLISLPQTLSTAQGRYHIVPVYGWENASRKRKRSELAVGIDGEGVNIYNVFLPPIMSLPLRLPCADAAVGGESPAGNVIRPPSSSVLYLSTMLDKTATIR